MKRFKEFLKANFIWACLGCFIYWGIPYIIVTLLGVFVSAWYFTIYMVVFTTQVALPAIPIIIGISLLLKLILGGKF